MCVHLGQAREIVHVAREVRDGHHRHPARQSGAEHLETQRLSARYGTHDRIAVTPASRFTFGERWDGDRCILWVEGIVRQDIAYGENLSLSRRYETALGSNTVKLVDTVTNDGFFETPHQLLYHFNLGYPLVDEGAAVHLPP